jgi:hypothetical protein
MKTFIAGLLGAIALATVAAPAFASEFVVVQDKATMKCSVVETTTTTTQTVITAAGSYQTQDEANTAMTKVTTCKS